MASRSSKRKASAQGDNNRVSNKRKTPAVATGATTAVVASTVGDKKDRKYDKSIYDSDDSDDDAEVVTASKSDNESDDDDGFIISGQCCKKHKGVKQGTPCVGCGKCFYQSNFIDGLRCQRCFDKHKYANGGVYPIGTSAQDIASDYAKQQRPALDATPAFFEQEDKHDSDDDILSESDDVLNATDKDDDDE